MGALGVVDSHGGRGDDGLPLNAKKVFATERTIPTRSQSGQGHKSPTHSEESARLITRRRAVSA